MINKEAVVLKVHLFYKRAPAPCRPDDCRWVGLSSRDSVKILQAGSVFEYLYLSQYWYIPVLVLYTFTS